jgi:putative endonuclease
VGESIITRRKPGGKPRRWLAYLIRCGDGSLYAGVTNDLPARLEAHAGGACGAKYTSGRGPFEVVWTQRAASRSAALRIEWRVKQLSRAEKLALIERKGRIRLEPKPRAR